MATSPSKSPNCTQKNQPNSSNSNSDSSINNEVTPKDVSPTSEARIDQKELGEIMDKKEQLQSDELVQDSKFNLNLDSVRFTTSRYCNQNSGDVVDESGKPNQQDKDNMKKPSQELIGITITEKNLCGIPDPGNVVEDSRKREMETKKKMEKNATMARWAYHTFHDPDFGRYGFLCPLPDGWKRQYVENELKLDKLEGKKEEMAILNKESLSRKRVEDSKKLNVQPQEKVGKFLDKLKEKREEIDTVTEGKLTAKKPDTGNVVHEYSEKRDVEAGQKIEKNATLAKWAYHTFHDPNFGRDGFLCPWPDGWKKQNVGDRENLEKLEGKKKEMVTVTKENVSGNPDPGNVVKDLEKQNEETDPITEENLPGIPDPENMVEDSEKGDAETKQKMGKQHSDELSGKRGDEVNTL